MIRNLAGLVDGKQGRLGIADPYPRRALLLWPLLWPLSIPFPIVGTLIGAILALFEALLFLPARVLGYRGT